MRAARLIGHLLLGALLAHTVLDRLVRAQRHDAMVRWWVRGILRILNVRLEIEGQACTEPALFAANHVSWLDIACLRAALDAEFVAKQEVARWPVIGHMAGLAGTLFLNRGERDASIAAANSMSRALAAGRSVAIFPEGTTGDGRRLGRFHARLYQAAIRTRRPVQAVAIAYPYPDDVQGCTSVAGDTTPGMEEVGQHREQLPRTSRATGVHPAAPFVGDDNLGRHVWSLLAEDGLNARLTLCPPIHAADERRALAERTRTQIASALDLETAAPVHRNVIAI